MKYNTTLRKFYLQPDLLKKLLFSFFVCAIAASTYAQTPCSARVIDDANFSYTGTGPAPTRWNFSQADTGGTTIDHTAFPYLAAGNFSTVNTNATGGTNNNTRQYAIVANPNTLSPQYANIPTDGMLVMNPLQGNSDQYFTYNINGLTPGNTYYIEIKVWNVMNLAPPSPCGNWCNWNDQLEVEWDGNANNAHDGQSNLLWSGTNGTSQGWNGNSNQINNIMLVSTGGSYAILTAQVTLASATTGFSLVFKKGSSSNPIVLGLDYVKVMGCATEAINVTGGSTSVCEATGFTLTAQGIGPAGSTYQWYQNGTLLPGRTSDTLNVVSPVGPGTTVTYKAVGTWDNISTTLTSKLCCSSTGGSSAEVLRQSFNGLAYTCPTGGTPDGSRHGGYANIPGIGVTSFIDGAYTYAGTGCSDLNDGQYAVVQSSYAGNYWQNRPEVKDHTGVPGSGALFINAIGGVGQAFYKFNLTGLCNGTRYDFSAWYASLATGSEIVPNMEFDVIDNTTGTTVASSTTGTIPTNEQWYNTDVTFQTPASGTPHTYTLQVVNLVSTGSGNDLMLDDIVVTKCTPFINLYLTGTQITADTVCSTSPVSISVTTYYDLPLAITGSSTGTVYYQWMSSTVPNAADGTWTLIGTPQTSGTLLVTPGATTTYYRAKVSATSAAAATGLAPLASDCGNDGLTTTFSLTKTGTLNPTATPVNSSYCIGNTMTLTGNPSTGVQWEWRKGTTYATATAIPGYTFSNTPAKEVFSKTVATGDDGYYYFVVQTSGGCTAYATDTVNINPLPTISLSSGSATQTVCSGTGIGTIKYAIGGSATGATLTGALPPGVTGAFAAGVFTINGTPTSAAGSPFNYTVTTTGSSCTEVFLSGTITVKPLSTIALTSGTATQTKCSGTLITPVVYTVGGGGTGAALTGTLPAGVTGVFSGTTFTISGTPTSATGSPFNYTVTTTGSGCTEASLSGTITINPVSTIALTSGTATQTKCSGTLITPVVYTVGGGATGATLTGSLPAGVAGVFSGTTFTISGTPTSATGSPFNYTVTTTGSSCTEVSLSGTITVNPKSMIVLTSGTATQTKCSGVLITPVVYTVGGGATGATLTGSLPPGVAGVFSGTTFTISGTPTSATGSPFNYTVTTTGSSCTEVSLSGTITINPLSTIALTSGTATQTKCSGTIITSVVYTVGGGATGAALTGALPAGVAGVFSGTTFTISGTPTSATGSPFNYTVTTTGSGCTEVSLSGTITVNPKSTIVLTSGTATQTKCSGTLITPVVYTVGGGATGATLTGTLPAGVAGVFSGTTFTISGTPTSATGSPFNYTVTTTGSSCTEVSLSGTITVNPVSTIVLTSGTATQTKCSGTLITPVVYTVGGGATGATLTGSLPAGVAGVFSGTTFTISGTPTSATGSPFNYTVTTTGSSCTEVSLSGTITINPLSTIALTSGTATQTKCSGALITPMVYTVGGGATGAALTGALPPGVTGVFSGTTFTISGTPTTATGSPFNYTVTTTGSSCTEVSLSGTITVNPILKPTVSCGTSTNTSVQFTWPAVTGATGYNTSYTVNGGGAVTGTGTSPFSVNALSPGDAVVLTVTPTGPGCFAASVPVTCNAVACTPSTVSVPANVVVCAGGTVAAATFTSTPAGATFAWTNSNPAIGLAASGTGNIASFTATNATASPITATITVTPTIAPCTGTANSYTITVKPLSTITLTSGTATQTKCSGTIITPVIYTIGGGATGAALTGTLPPGVTGVFSGTTFTISGTPTTAAGSPFNYTVTTTGSTCTEVSLSGTITVKPLSTIVLTSGPATQTKCSGTLITPVVYTVGGGATGAALTGTLPPGVTGVFSGTTFTISGTPTSATGSPFNYTVTTTGSGCTEVSLNGTITVNPLSTIVLTSGPATQTKCSGTIITSVVYTIGGGATGAALTGALPPGVTGVFSGTTFTISGTPTSATGSPFNYTVTTTGSSCTEVSLSGTITVNPILTPTVSCGTSTNTSVQFTWPAVTGATGYNTSYTVNGGGAVTGTGTSPFSVNALSPGDAVVLTVTPTGPGCFAASVPVTCNAVACTPSTVSVPANVVVCAGGTVAAATFTSTPAGATFAWTNSNPAIGLAASGTGNIASFTATNATASPITATITVTPTIPPCAGTANSYTITVNPLSTITLTTGSATQTKCSGTIITPVVYTAGGAATGAALTGTLPPGVTGVFSAGTFTISGTPTSATGSPFNYTVTTTGSSCTEVSLSGTLTVNPILMPTVSCGTSTNTSVQFTWPAVTGATGYNTSYSVNGGPAVTGTGTSPFNVSPLSPGDAVVLTVTPTGAGCFAASTPVTCNAVACTPSTVSVPANVVVCAGGTVAATTFTSTPAGATFAWTNSNPAIGIAASGTGDIASFTATNTTTAPITATITVTPTIPPCAGTASSYTITVNPLSTMVLSSGSATAPAVCSGTAITPIVYTAGGGATGIALTGTLPTGVTGVFSGTTFTISGTPTTAAGSPYNYTVTTTGSSCTEVSLSGTVTVNPILAPTVSCGTSTNTSVQFTWPAVTGATGYNTSYSINGGPAVTGTGTSPFNVSPLSPGDAVVLTVTPTGAGCFAASTPVTCNAVACTPSTVSVPADVVVCAGGTVAATTFTSTPAGATFAWTNSNPAIGIAASGTGDIASFTATNTTTAPITATITVTPTIAPCTGTANTYTITVNPLSTIVLTSGSATPTVCSASAITPVVYTVGGGATGAALTGTLPAGVTGVFSGSTFTISGTPTTAAGSPFNYTVTTTGSSCTEVSLSGTVTVNPILSPTVVCGTTTTTSVQFTWAAVTGATGYNTSYSVNGGPAVTGTGTSPFNITPLNPGDAVALTVTPTGAGCFAAGTGNCTAAACVPSTVSVPANVSVCNGGTVAATAFTSTPAGATFSWTNSNTAIGLGASGTGDIASFTGTNLTNAPITATITVTPTIPPCTGTPNTYTITINPTPVVVIADPAAVCSPSTVDITAAAVTAGSTLPAGTTLSYYTDAAATTAVAAPAAVTTSGTYYIEALTGSGCSDIKPVTVVVNPTPALMITDPAAVCYPSGVDITAASVTAGSTLPAGTTLGYYTDAAATATLAGPSAVKTSGTYYIKAVTGSGCNDVKPVVVTINPTPVVVISNPASVCSPSTVDITAPAVTAGSTLPAGTTLSYYTNAAATTALATPAAVTTSGTYYIKALTGSGCSDIKPVTVTVNPSPVLIISNPDAKCTPLTIDITNPAVAKDNSNLPANTVYNYFSDATATVPVTSPEAIADSGLYYIQATLVPSGCSTIAPVPVTIYTSPLPPQVTALKYCQDDIAPALTADAAPGNTLVWYQTSTGGPGRTTAPVPSTQISGSDPYYVTQKDVHGCESLTRAELDVRVTTLPKVTVNPGVIEDEDDATGSPTFPVTLSGTATGYKAPPQTTATTVAWTQGGFATTVGITPEVDVAAPATITPLDSTRYYFVGTSVENTACADTASVLVKIVQRLKIPDIFSPNGDGVNDFWDIGNIQAYDNAEVSIFNRYGQFVYKSGNGYKTPWDGNYHGQPLPIGTYFYIIKRTPDSKPISGDISIVR